MELEGYLSDDSCGLITDEECQKFQTMTPDGKPLPLHDNLSLNVEVPSARKKKRNKKRKSKWMCQPCEITGMASFAPLTKAHYRTHMPKHPDCEICRLTKPQASPHLRISDERKKAFGKVDDEGRLIEVRRPADAHKLPEHFGDLITADHMTTIDEDEQSCLKDSVVLTIQDKATYMIWGHPAKHKDANQSIKGFKKFPGPGEESKVQLCYTDGSKGLDKTCEELHFRHDTSVPYCPEMNGISEASVRCVKERS